MFLADPAAGDLNSVSLLTRDAHAGLVRAIVANLRGSTWAPISLSIRAM